LCFLIKLLEEEDEKYTDIIRWENRDEGIFRILNPNNVAALWGYMKNSLHMNYDKMSRALRYYYKVNVLSKCGRLCYKFHWDNALTPKLEAVNKINMTIPMNVGFLFNHTWLGHCIDDDKSKIVKLKKEKEPNNKWDNLSLSINPAYPADNTSLSCLPHTNSSNPKSSNVASGKSTFVKPSNTSKSAVDPSVSKLGLNIKLEDVSVTESDNY